MSACTFGKVFSSRRFTEPAIQLAHFALPQSILLWTGDQITGAIFIGPANEVGMLNDVGMVKGIIQTRTPLGAWKDFLRDNPFDIRRLSGEGQIVNG